MKTSLRCAPYLLLILLLMSGKSLQKVRNRELKITTNVYAHYAMTEVAAKFESGPEAREVNFYMTMPEDAFVTGFKIEVNGKTCTATIEELKEAQRIYSDAKNVGNSSGITVSLIPGESKQKFETKVNVQRHATGRFVLTYEASTGRKNGDESQPYVLEIPVETKAIYEEVKITYDIKEDLVINRSSIHTTAELFILKSLDEVEVKANVLKDDKKPNNWVITFTSKPYNIKTCNDDCFGLEGNFVVEYDVVRSSGRYLLETFVTQDSVAALISPNPTVNSDISQEVIVVMDTSGSMEYNNKLRSIADVVAEKVLERVGENDKITLIEFDDNVNKLGTFTGAKESIRDARRKIADLSAGGLTNINDALLEALDYANQRVENDGSSSVPVIIFYTDGKPEGNGDYVIDQEIIKENVKAKNRNGFPIFSMAVGSGEVDKKFLKDISIENNGKFFDLTGKSDQELRDQLDESYIFVQRQIFSTNNELTIQSPCLDESTFNNDIAKQNKIKFLGSNSKVDQVDLANVKFKKNLPKGEPCEVLVTYGTTVRDQDITEKAKICFPDGPRGRHMRINPSKQCPSRITSHRRSEPTTKTLFIDRLRAFKEIKKELSQSKTEDEELVKRAKEANFAVGGLTAFVVVATSDSGQCETQETKIKQTGPAAHVQQPLANCPSRTRCEVTFYSSTNYGGEAENFCDDNINLKDWNNKVASIEVTKADGHCPGILLYEKPNFQGDYKFFPVGLYPSVMDLKKLFKNAQSMKLAV